MATSDFEQLSRTIKETNANLEKQREILADLKRQYGDIISAAAGGGFVGGKLAPPIEEQKQILAFYKEVLNNILRINEAASTPTATATPKAATVPTTVDTNKQEKTREQIQQTVEVVDKLTNRLSLAKTELENLLATQNISGRNAGAFQDQIYQINAYTIALENAKRELNSLLAQQGGANYIPGGAPAGGATDVNAGFRGARINPQVVQ
jgi:prefoldin subunit 5